MNWKAFKRHFQAAAEPEPAPFGPDAIEWDYSRYSRALGLTTQPGLHDLPYTAFAMMATQPKYWERARERQERWATELGWRTLRISARPTVAVPDPVVWALGHSAAGNDGLMFVRSGRGGRPYVGKRRRPAGCSIALTPGERWLIAGERVRRRFRAALAVHGHALFIEEAEYLTPAAINLLAYLGNAHRAWRARMVVSSAPLHILLATTPEYEIPVRRALDRADVKGDVVVLREPEPGSAEATKRDPLPEPLTVEEEHLVAALQAAPIALAKADLPGIFGSSVKATVARLIERGVLILRTEDSVPCVLVASPAPPLPEPPARVIEALAAHYRERLRRGRCHEHLAPAAAMLRFRLQDRTRAVALFNRTPAANFATVPLRLADELDRRLDEAAPPPRCDLLAGRLALRAHFHDYDSAKRHAHDITNTPIRTEPELARMLCCLVGLGHNRRRRSIDSSFWARLSGRVALASIIDIVAVLADLSPRIQTLEERDLADRFNHVSSAIAVLYAGGDRRPEPIRPLSYRVDGYVAAWHDRLRLYVSHQIPQLVHAARTLRPGILNTGSSLNVPASFVRATESLKAAWRCDAMSEQAHRAIARSLVGTTGNPEDARVSETGILTVFSGKKLRLLSRQLADETILCHSDTAPPRERTAIQASIQPICGDRNWFVGADLLYLTAKSPAGRQGVRRVFAAAEMANQLSLRGEHCAAVESARIAVSQRSGVAEHRALAVLQYLRVLRRALLWDELRRAIELVEAEVLELRSSLTVALREYFAGCVAVTEVSWAEAERAFRSSATAIRSELNVSTRPLFRAATQDAESCSRLHGALSSPDGCGRVVPLSGLLDIATLDQSPLSASGLTARCGQSADYFVGVLESWAREARQTAEDKHHELLDLVASVLSTADQELAAAEGGLIGTLAKWAPSAYALLTAQARSFLGAGVDSSSSPSEVRAAIRVSETSRRPLMREETHRIHKDPLRHRMRIDRQGCVSARRRARRDERLWLDDASVYSELSARAARVDASTAPAEFHAYGWCERHPNQALGLMYTVSAVGSRGRAAIGLDVASWNPAECSTEAVGAPDGVVARGRVTHSGSSSANVIGTAPELSFTGPSQAAQEVRRLIRAAGKCRHAVLIIGETGVGKEVVASAIHALSCPTSREMVAANCACGPAHLLESELFGHERGAFTGAVARRAGLIEQADGSTLFLDEIDSMPRRMQAALLRVLENGEFRRIGGQRVERSKFRVVAAAQPGLRGALLEGGFREDLYYRLSTILIRIPPLRERPEDAAMIARNYVAASALRVDPTVYEFIAGYEWPGNVREMLNLFDACGALFGRETISKDHVENLLARRSSPAIEVPNAGESRDPARNAWARVEARPEFQQSFGARSFAAATGVSPRSAQRFLARLVRAGLLVRDGAGRGTTYLRQSDAR